MSETRPPTRSPVHERESDGLDDLEELGDDAIIAQQTAAHAPRPRANVSEESRSVVITDHPRRRDTQPPRASAPRSSAEATLVIRDRRALDALRSDIIRRKTRRTNGRRALYFWGALGLAAFVLGGIVAFLATDDRLEPTAADSQALSGRIDAPLAQSRATTAANNAAAPTPTSAAPADAPHAVRLDDLPVEPPHKH